MDGEYGEMSEGLKLYRRDVSDLNSVLGQQKNKKETKITSTLCPTQFISTQIEQTSKHGMSQRRIFVVFFM